MIEIVNKLVRISRQLVQALGRETWVHPDPKPVNDALNFGGTIPNRVYNPAIRFIEATQGQGADSGSS